LEFGVEGLEPRIWGSGLVLRIKVGVWGLQAGVWGWGVKVWGLGLGV
jgi:hypothetical protein